MSNYRTGIADYAPRRTHCGRPGTGRATDSSAQNGKYPAREVYTANADQAPPAEQNGLTLSDSTCSAARYLKPDPMPQDLIEHVIYTATRISSPVISKSAICSGYDLRRCARECQRAAGSLAECIAGAMHLANNPPDLSCHFAN
jgi:hypothetical protein